MAETTPRPRRRPYVRVVMIAAALFTAWHILASFLWIAPYSASAREIVGQERLSSYMIPMLGQSWSVFAPEPINGDYRFEVRAVVNGEETEWVSASDVELSMIRYHLFTPRAGIVGMDVSSQYKGAWGKLNEDQQGVVGLNYFKDDWEERMETALKAYGTDNVSAYMDQERRATAYATQVALAIWGDDVERIQYQATRQNVIPYEQRHDPDVERPGIQYSFSGWRGLIEVDGQSQDAFTKVFRAQYERMNK